MRLINADELVKIFHREGNSDAWGGEFIRRTIEEQPTIEAVPLEDYRSMERTAYNECLCTLQMVKQYIKALPTVPLDWKSIMDDWTEHDNAMIAKGREIERRLNATKHGRWISENMWDYKCSVCGVITRHTRTNYCGFCGARMDEVAE